MTVAGDNHFANYSDNARRDISIVQTAMDKWRTHNDPADDHGLTMAEVIVLDLYAAGRLQ